MVPTQASAYHCLKCLIEANEESVGSLSHTCKHMRQGNTCRVCGSGNSGGAVLVPTQEVYMDEFGALLWYSACCLLFCPPKLPLDPKLTGATKVNRSPFQGPAFDSWERWKVW
jgi:hypothetical protein